MTKEEIEELRFLLILSKMKENDKLADVLADVDISLFCVKLNS